VKQNRDCEFQRHFVEGFDDVGSAFFDHACSEERRIGHVVGLRRRILDVKVGHEHISMQTTDGRSARRSRDFQSRRHFAKMPSGST
jgi:hypothetical protein